MASLARRYAGICCTFRFPFLMPLPGFVFSVLLSNIIISDMTFRMPCIPPQYVVSILCIEPVLRCRITVNVTARKQLIFFSAVTSRKIAGSIPNGVTGIFH